MEKRPMTLKNRKLRIVLLQMTMDIGGAETHVLALAQRLHQLNHHVVVVSNGGVYTKVLEDAGIKHVFAPLVKKNPRSLKKSFDTVKQLIMSDDIDLIHAHGRIPSLIGEMVGKSTNHFANQ